MSKNGVTIVIPHYQTSELIKLCLRSVRSFTPLPYRVIVVDNGSRDDSLPYLRSLEWITMIERNNETIKPGSWAHGTALDIGLKATDTSFFLSLHSDVVIAHSSWLSTLLGPFENDPHLACVGSGKLEEISPGYRLIKRMGDIKGLIRSLRRTCFQNESRNHDDQPEYVRTTCAMYRTEILKKEGLSFCPIEEKGLTSGQMLYYELVERGYPTRYLPPSELKKSICHLNHGTMVLNPFLGARKRTVSRGMSRIARKLKEDSIQHILANDNLDR